VIIVRIRRDNQVLKPLVNLDVQQNKHIGSLLYKISRSYSQREDIGNKNPGDSGLMIIDQDERKNSHQAPVTFGPGLSSTHLGFDPQKETVSEELERTSCVMSTQHVPS
jgi:hypothetical protein